MVEQDCVKFSRETERREQAGTNVWHPISTHLALIAAGHLLPLIIWGLYNTHTHTQSISHHIIYLCLVFSVTDTKIIPLISHITRNILRIAYNSLVFLAWLWTHTLTIRAAHVDDDFQRRLLCWQQCFGLSQLQSVSLKTHSHTTPRKSLFGSFVHIQWWLNFNLNGTDLSK